jgi:hypothetical protein
VRTSTEAIVPARPNFPVTSRLITDVSIEPVTRQLTAFHEPRDAACGL